MGYRGVLVDIHMHTLENLAITLLTMPLLWWCKRHALRIPYFLKKKKIVKYLSKHLLEKMSLRKLCLKEIHFRIKIRSSVSTESKWKHNEKHFRKKCTEIKYNHPSIYTHTHENTYIHISRFLILFHLGLKLSKYSCKYRAEYPGFLTSLLQHKRLIRVHSSTCTTCKSFSLTPFISNFYSTSKNVLIYSLNVDMDLCEVFVALSTLWNQPNTHPSTHCLSIPTLSEMKEENKNNGMREAEGNKKTNI